MSDLESKIGINLKPVYCPICGEKQPTIRKPKGLYEIFWGGYTCVKCGCKMDKFGKIRKNDR
jgi:hypothetical protein